MPANQKYLRKDRLDLFLNPRSVAIVGASRKSGPGSFNLIENMRAFGYTGKSFPVNPQADEILGLKVLKDIRDIPEAVDIAILNTPREVIPRIIEDCAAKGIAGVIVVPQGFADADEEGTGFRNSLRDWLGTRASGSWARIRWGSRIPFPGSPPPSCPWSGKPRRWG